MSLQTIENESPEYDDVPGDDIPTFDDQELKELFFALVWEERQNILKYVSTRTPEQLQAMSIGTLLDMMVGGIFQLIDGATPYFPPSDISAFPVDGEVYYTLDGEEKVIEEGAMVNDAFLSEDWETFVQSQIEQGLDVLDDQSESEAENG